MSKNFSGISCFNKDIFITEKDRIWRYKNNIWSQWLIAYDTQKELNTRIDYNKLFTVIGSTSYIMGFIGFGILYNNTTNKYIGILNTDLGHLSFNLVTTATDYITPVLNSKVLKADLFGTSCRDFQVIPEVNTVFSCGLSTEPVTGYQLSQSNFTAPIRYMTYSPQVISNITANISYTSTQIFYKNYTIGSDLYAYLINAYNDYGISQFNIDQLYLNQTNLVSIAVLKDVPAPIHYLADISFTWLPSENDINYIQSTVKYNRLNFLLQTNQSLTSINVTLGTNTEIPFVPTSLYRTN